MTLYLVRHAHAGSRHEWRGRDEERPLSAEGRAQAEALARWMGDRPVDRVLSSRAVRCQQTVAAVAARHGLPVDVSAPLFEGSSASQGMDLLRREATADVVLCSHGDVIPELVGALAEAGCDIVGRRHAAKGALYVIEVDAGRFVRATYVEEPARVWSGR